MYIQVFIISIKMPFPFYQQLDAIDCGVACLRMIAKHYGKAFSVAYLRQHAHLDRQGVSVLGLSHAAEQIGLRTLAVKTPFAALEQEPPVPFVAHWHQNHFVVVYRIRKGKVYVADPASQKIVYTQAEFEQGWAVGASQGEKVGISLLIEPTPAFYEEQEGEEKSSRVSMGFLLGYLKPYRALILQLFLGLLVGNVLALLAPLLTQGLVDMGIQRRDLPFVYVLLIAQLMLFLGNTSLGILRAWILLHISARVNIALISDFLAKLMLLPISFFDSKNLGDIRQRIGDHQRIQSFLTSSSLDFVFSISNFVVFSVIVISYSPSLFAFSIFGSVVYVTWVLFFMKQRRILDQKRFNQSATYQATSLRLSCYFVKSMTLVAVTTFIVLAQGCCICTNRQKSWACLKT